MIRCMLFASACGCPPRIQTIHDTNSVSAGSGCADPECPATIHVKEEFDEFGPHKDYHLIDDNALLPRHNTAVGNRYEANKFFKQFHPLGYAKFKQVVRVESKEDLRVRARNAPEF